MTFVPQLLIAFPVCDPRLACKDTTENKIQEIPALTGADILAENT